jgi:pSer/pThr/pTyr-binding forkhead associated (FHA) protein
LPETPIPAPAAAPPVSPAPQPAAPIAAVSGATNPATQLQKQSASLMHVQSQNQLELPPNLSVIHIGKPNDLVPPDVDVSGFPHAEVVSRTHADIRVEGDAYYIEDVGSSNGTYINNIPLPKGNRHRLRPGDRISLGKGDLVSFIFQLS